MKGFIFGNDIFAEGRLQYGILSWDFLVLDGVFKLIGEHPTTLLAVCGRLTF
jgi:hypothetical protein